MRGTDVLQLNLTYFIVTFQRDENGQMINLAPLLIAKAAKKYCDIMTKTRRSSRKGSSIKSTLKQNNNSNKSNESSKDYFNINDFPLLAKFFALKNLMRSS